MKTSTIIARCIMAALLAAPALFAEPAQDIKRAEELLKHAQTYHWLGRWKYNDTAAFLKAEEYAARAADLPAAAEGREADRIRTLAQSMKDGLAIRYDNNFDTLTNMLPLFTLLTGDGSTYVYIDDPEVLALEAALEAAIQSLPAARPDLQLFTVVTSTPKNTALEEEALAVLTRYGRFFPRPPEDILQAVPPARAALLYSKEDRPEVLADLAAAWDKNHLLLVEILQNDIIDDVYYFGAFFRLYDSRTGTFTQSLYSDGFAEDRRGIPGVLILLFLLHLGAACLIPYLVHLLLLFQPRRDRGTASLPAGPLSFLVGLVTSLLLCLAARPLAPEPEELMIQFRSLAWLLILALTASGTPAVLSYLAGSRIPGIREKTGNADTLGTFISGGFLGSSAVLAALYTIRFGPAAGVLQALLSAVTILFTGALGGSGLFQFFSRGRRAALALPAAGLGLYTLSFCSLTAGSHPGMILAAGAAVLLYLVYILIHFLPRVHRAASEQKAAGTASSSDLTLQTLSSLAAEPAVYVDPSETGDFITNRVDTYFSFLSNNDPTTIGRSDPFYVIRIAGGPGTGKTRTAQHLAKALQNRNEEISGRRGTVLFGDCDEMNADGSGVPFEPFAQAFHELLGAGRFEPPDKRAAKIAEGLKTLGLETALGAVGMGALGSLMGLEGGGNASGFSSAREMAHTLCRALLELADRSGAPAVLILDDLHYIDPLSAELLEKLFRRLAEERRTRRVVLILTEDPGRMPEKDEASPIWADTLENCRIDGEAVVEVLSERDISNPERFDDLLTDALHFTPDAANLLLRHLAQYSPTSIMSILQSVSRLVQLGGVLVDERTGRVSITPRFDFYLLPPPTALQKLVMEKLEGLSDRQRNIVECAAFVGYEFKAEILADVLAVDRLVLLHELRILESLGILHDLVDQDDIYAFNSTALAAAVRHQANVSDQERVSEVPQVVREYHHRIARSLIHQMERLEDSPETLPVNNLITLARRSYAAGDRMIPEAFRFNVHAARRAARLGRYSEAMTFARQAADCSSKLPSLRQHPEALAMKELILEMGTVVMSPRTKMEPVFLEAVHRSDTLKSAPEKLLRKTCIILRWADFLLSRRETDEVQPEDLLRLQEKMEGLRQSSDLPPLLTLKTELTISRLKRAAGIEADHSAVLKDLLRRLEALKTEDDTPSRIRFESELLEDYGVEQFMMEDLEGALESMGRAIELKKSPSVGDTEGILKLKVYIAEGHSRRNNKEKALEVLEGAYETAGAAGAVKHRISIALNLGRLKADTDAARAAELFIRSYQDARSVTDFGAQARALISLLSLAAERKDANLAGEYEREVRDLLDYPLPEDLRKDLEDLAGRLY